MCLSCFQNLIRPIDLTRQAGYVRRPVMHPRVSKIRLICSGWPIGACDASIAPVCIVVCISIRPVAHTIGHPGTVSYCRCMDFIHAAYLVVFLFSEGMVDVTFTVWLI